MQAPERAFRRLKNGCLSADNWFVYEEFYRKLGESVPTKPF